jgi:hypothetical protein
VLAAHGTALCSRHRRCGPRHMGQHP